MTPMLIAVAAGEHPELDGWVWEQARAEADKSGLLLGDYLGREDVLPHPEGLCCHVFAAEPAGTPKEPTPVTEIDIYAVGLLADLRRFIHSPEPLRARWTRLRFDLRRSVMERTRRREWRALRNYFNGYLAEHATSGTRCGHGWTRGRAYKDLMRHLSGVTP